MAISNRDRIQRVLELLRDGLRPYVDQEFEACYGDNWRAEAAAVLHAGQGGVSEPDFTALTGMMLGAWDPVFSRGLGKSERAMVFELRDARNRWAHQEAFSTEDTYRFMDSAERILSAICAPQASEVQRQRQDLLRQTYELQRQNEQRKAATAATKGEPRQGLRPWRILITPHPDVQSGRFQQAEFMADLWQVHLGHGADEYRDPKEFFRRTYLTRGLRELLKSGIQRLLGTGGPPVVELQTNFGGGKTHAMLALYHLFSGTLATALPGMEELLAEEGLLPADEKRGTWSLQRAVLVGQKISPGQPQKKADGTVVHTLWGELAYQLAQRAGYELVQQADETGTNPGDALRVLFETCTPCLILIDEWVAYARQLYGKTDLPGGSFDAHFTFAQALTEAAAHVPGTFLVVSLPASEYEVGGAAGAEALDRLKHALGRVETPWRPANADEGFEIVRRRLFEPIETAHARSRDAVIRAFTDLYGSHRGDFPAEVNEGGYKTRMELAYPIHPELFDRLYDDWSTLDKFQRTRGVLRLMATTIHALWSGGDSGLMIMPSSIPIDAPQVQNELTRYLPDPWVPVIENEVDGPRSLALKLDSDNPAMGRYSACRRVARTIYMGSAPTLETAQKGIELRRIRLGCVQPGEQTATFGDALARLVDSSTHLYADGQRYWYSTQPSVLRAARERAEQIPIDAVREEMRRRMRDMAAVRGDFARVHVCPASPSDIPDEREARLVILDPEATHTSKQKGTAALAAAAEILDSRGAGPRVYRNSLVFLAADPTALALLEQAVRELMAWESIHVDRESLNLDAYQANQAKTKRQAAEEAVRARIPAAYVWLLAPGQERRKEGSGDPAAPVTWQESRLQGSDAPALRAARKLRDVGALITELGVHPLRLELDRVPLWRGDHVHVRQLADDFAQYLYLPRLASTDVLLKAIKSQESSLFQASEGFAYAGAWDPVGERYLGLQVGRVSHVALDDESLVVKPEVAQRQQDQERPESGAAAGGEGDASGGAGPVGGAAGGATAIGGSGAATAGTGRPAVAVQPRRFHGSVRLEPIRAGRDASKIAEEVIQHLVKLAGSEVEVTLDIRAIAPRGVPEETVRVVTENCRELKFGSHGFEEE